MVEQTQEETQEQKNIGGRPPNPKLKFQPKEFDLVKWVSERQQYKDPGKFVKVVVMNYCKNFYLEQKKRAEERKQQQEIKKEEEELKLIEEIESEGGIEKQKKYVRSHKKKPADDLPVMEGQI